jgi:non-lysosomal glucosylceramidase
MSGFPVLSRYGRTRLRAIAMPVGGIGTGCFALAGDGALVDWQLMSRPHRGWRPPLAHLLLWVRMPDGKRYLRVLEGMLRLQLDADHGVPQPLAGIPRMRAVGFEASYPFGRALLRDPLLPLEVSIEAFNPLIPEATDDSSLPFGLLTLTVSNRGKQPLEASVIFLLTNFIGDDGVQQYWRGNISDFAEVSGWRGVLFRKEPAQRSPRWGTLALLCDGESVEVARRWKVHRLHWNVPMLRLIDALLSEGRMEDAAPNEPCPPSNEQGWDSTLAARFPLPARSQQRVRFLLCWHFPYRDLRELGWWQGREGEDSIVRNYYTLRFRDALDVASHVLPRLDELQQRTLQFVRSVVAKHPPAFCEAALNCLAVLRSPTCFRLEDGTFCGFEGCNATTGCCFGSCTHVWNYEEATLALFPDLHRSMLESHLTYGITDDGAQRFRLDLPLGRAAYGLAAADGQMGLIVRTYQQYRHDGDREWLQKFYPKLKQMLAFAWQPGSWDANRDGVMEGAQHNTYDIEFLGPNPVCGTWYLAALRTMEEMATLLGDRAFARECRQLFEQGSHWIDENLFNGEYYVQQIQQLREKPHPMTSGRQPNDPNYHYHQAGGGCLIDQLIGQYKANRAGLGDLLNRDHIVQALRSIIRYNFRRHFHQHYNDRRVYATGDESGVLIASYPRGGRPEVPFPYWAECWTGLEYAFARLLLDYGLYKEALQVVQAVRARHDGAKRNPFNEPECGSYYARCMSAWSLVQPSPMRL